MTITPDTKDWTWVVELRCPECGFDARSIPATEVAARLRTELVLWREALADDASGERPGPTTWSTLEYACHVRDVCTIYDKRLHLMLDADDPLFENWDQDETAVGQAYGEQEPAEVLGQLVAEAERLASSFDTVTAEQWQRPGRRSDGAVFTIDTFARYLLHDVVHHGWDVTGIEAAE